MIRLTRIVHLAVCLVAGFAATSCRVGAPLPLPDAARASGLTLTATPGSLVIRPGSSGRIRFVLRDDQGQPVQNYPLAFTIQDDSGSDGSVDARLSTEQALTDGTGGTFIEIIVGNLAGDNRPASFSIHATCPGAVGGQADILVTTNAYSVEVLPVPADVLLGATSIVNTRLLFFDNTTCGTLNLVDINTAPARPRTAHTVAANASFVFSGVAASGSHAVVGYGLDSNTFVQIGGCLDVPGASLYDSETIRATLFMDRLFPIPLGTFQVSSDLRLVPPPRALAGLQSTWRQWTRCPLDPARLWLDCTIDALATDATSDPLDCVPALGAEGALGDLLLQRRGTQVAPSAGTTTTATDTPCRASTDNTGSASLEALVDGLFADTRGQLLGARLGAFPDEIAAMVNDLRIDSQMTITPGNDLNSYMVEHTLVGLTFPDAVAPISFKVARLGLPVSTVSGILATFKAGQLSIPSHGFTLRLGTTTRYAFEASSFKTRGATDELGIVNGVFGLAQWTEQGTLLSGCAALDAVACDQVHRSRGCLLTACQLGLGALASKLTKAFDELDGTSRDFFLSGSTPVVDLDGDGRADALGLGGRAGSISAAPGLWSAVFDASGNTYVVYGSWTASRLSKSP